MPTDPLTGSRYPNGTDVPDVAQYIQNAVIDLSDNTIPRFSTTTARDTAYSAWVTLGGTMANGMQCTVNGVPYRRINGTWRIDRPRGIVRTLSLTGGAGTISAGGSNETGITSGVALTGGGTFTLYEATTVLMKADARAGGASAVAQVTVKIDGAVVGNVATSRNDGTVGCTGGVALAAGSHTIAMRVDASGSTVGWVDGVITLTETTAE